MRHHWQVALGVCVSVALTLPFAIRQNAWFEWANPYWQLLLQRDEIIHSGRPSYFIHTAATGVFYPFHLFYAGFTISALACAAVLVPAWVVFSITLFGSFFAAFVGAVWMSRAFGVSSRLGAAAACLYITNPQYVAKLYVRGAWAEFVAVSMATLLLGAALLSVSKARTDTHSRTSIACVGISSALLAGTHNITLVLTVPVIALIVAAFAWSTYGTLRPTGRALVGPTLAALVGFALTGAFLVPNLWLSGSTAITGWDFSDKLPDWNSASAVLRPHVTGSEARANEAPSLLLAPILLLIAYAISKRRRGDQRRAFTWPTGVGALLVVVLLVLTTNGRMWSDRSSVLHQIVPDRALRTIQFPSRLTAFLTLALLVVLLSLLPVAHGRIRRVTSALVVAAGVWYVAVALGFVWTVDRTAAPGAPETSRSSITIHELPPAFAPGQQVQFRLTETGTAVDKPARSATFSGDGHLVEPTSLAIGEPVATNIVWSPLVRLEGARVLGRDADGTSVIVPTAARPTVRSARPLAVLLGWALSVLGVASAGSWVIREMLPRRRSRSSQHPPDTAAGLLGDEPRAALADQRSDDAEVLHEAASFLPRRSGRFDAG
jgi:hypothetical protein